MKTNIRFRGKTASPGSVSCSPEATRSWSGSHAFAEAAAEAPTVENGVAVWLRKPSGAYTKPTYAYVTAEKATTKPTVSGMFRG